MRTLGARLLAGAAAVRADERGNVLVYVTLCAAVLLAIVGLALDGGRAMITHSEAQAAADAAALAGASQLDGQTGACARAKTEATVVTNRQRFAQGGAADVTIASGSPVCLSSLPSSDGASTSTLVTTNDAASKYIQVTTQQLTHQNTLLDALVSQRTATIQRTAVAGFRRSLCAAGPVMMSCDTLTWTPGKAFDAWGNNASAKGWISDGNDANSVSNTLASTQPSFCIKDDSIGPAPGNKTTKAQDGINKRFGQSSSTTYPSDLDIMDFTSYSIDLSGGTGWNCLNYWNANHASDGLAKPVGCTNGTTSVTRYSVYQAERFPDPSTGTRKIPAAGRPPAGTATTTDERRLVYLAIYDCANTAVPKYFIKAFLLAPSTGQSVKTAYVEPIAVSTSQTDPTAIHEEVQLYR